ncbi:hypothetical protein J3459_008654 [Metarhizium acridum]|nr:hypothetical protein J3459_008654 [Metarhizium acridum]
MATETTTQEFLPVLGDVAKSQADPKTNYSLVIAVEASTPGLLVTHWASHGADGLALGLFAQSPRGQLKGLKLYPMILSTEDETGEKRSYRLIIKTVPRSYNPEIPRINDVNAIEWITLDAFTYGGISIDEFVFIY